MSSALSFSSTKEIISGVLMPIMGLGVYKTGNDDDGYQAIRTALDLGYRHIDTASIYGNEETVGRAIADSGIARDELFITTKCWLNEMGTAETPEALHNSLKRLRLDYVDLYLMHWPDDATMLATWQAMRSLRDHKFIRAIGISNCTNARLDRFLPQCEELPAVHQYETHLFLQQPERIEYAHKHGITTTAYSPLARGKRLDNPTLVAIAEKYAATPAQVMLRWCLERGMTTIAKSVSPERLQENATILISH